jgi:hypothetical protein
MAKGRRQRLDENGGRRQKQFKRSTPTYEFRLAVVRFFKATTIAKTLQRFYPSLTGIALDTARKNVYHWAKNIAKIEAAGCSSALKALKKIRAP